MANLLHFRVWITQGKVTHDIPESELALLRPHKEQKEIIDSFKASKNSEASASTSSIKQRTSKSRLSMKLSKLSSKSSKKDLKSPTSPDSIEEKIAKSDEDDDDEATLKADLTYNVVEGDKAKRISRLGSFLNPESSEAAEDESRLGTAASTSAIRFRGQNRSPSAIVQVVRWIALFKKMPSLNDF